MASTYVNDLRLEEMATGDQSGTWGDTTNTNLELIAEAFSYGTEASFGSDADATTTIADGASDPARSLYLKITSGVSLTATRTLTIAPNTVSKVWIIENATSGSQSINISQGSGANATIPNGDVKVVYSDGAGSGAAVVDAFTDLNLSGTTTVAALDAGSGAITTTGTVTGGTLAGTLSTAAQPNITSVGTLTGFTSTGIDDNATTTAITIDSSENVGIGTASPASKLHIFDGGSSVNNTITFGNPSATPKGEIKHTASGSEFLNISCKGTTSGFGNIAFYTGSTPDERMRIDSSGNVGIGVSSISTQGQLYIGASGTSTDAKIALSPTNSSGGQNPLAQIGSTADGTYGSELYFTTRSTGGTVSERMRIDSAGRVAIGTDSILTDTRFALHEGNVDLEFSLDNAVADTARIFAFDRGTTTHKNLQLRANQTEFYSGSAEAMRIDSSGNVGIGTSSIASGGANTQNVQIHNSTANSTYLKLSTSGTGATASDGLDLIMGNDGTAYVWNRENSNTIFATDNQERLRITSSGVVDIKSGGTSSAPSLIFEGDTNTGLFHGGDTLGFSTAGSEAMRIDSSGNLLVGKTATAASTDGIALLGTNGMNVSRGNANVVTINRNTSDGSIITFQKDGSTVGSISTTGSNVVIGTGSVGLRFYDGGNAVIPHTAAGGSSNGLVDLGQGGFNEFKDLYLSGGAYLGGTASANKLDDYEEGTWTPNLNAFTGSYSVQVGRYIKVGKLVTASFHLDISVTGGSGALILTGLPFTAANVTNYYGGVTSLHCSAWATTTKPDGGLINPNTTNLALYKTQGQLSASSPNLTDMGGGNLIGVLVYEST